MKRRTDNVKIRNTEIRKELERLRGEGLYVKEIVPILADKYFLAEATVLDVIYDKRRA